jgi:OmpA-OmpF porin, OOP family
MSTSSANLTASARGALAALALACAVPAVAQSESGTGMLLPGSGRNAVGLSMGTAASGHLGCGAACDETDVYLHLFGRSLFGGHWGAQVGLLDLGDLSRSGADTRARGLNLSLVGRVPLGAKFSGWGRVGTTYSQAMSPSLAWGLAGSHDGGFGLSYGLGVSWDFSPRLSAVVEWDSHDLRFHGVGRDPVRATSLGLRYRY